jgi:hypothetical protein
MSDFAKCLGEILGGIAVVFDDQKAHVERAILAAAGARPVQIEPSTRCSLLS